VPTERSCRRSCLTTDPQSGYLHGTYLHLYGSAYNPFHSETAVRQGRLSRVPGPPQRRGYPNNRGAPLNRGGTTRGGTQVARPCLTPNCPHLATRGPRCVDCTRQQQQHRDRQRGTRQQRGYDATYQQARAALHLEAHPPCTWCDAPATTADHWPPMQVAGPHTHLVPACDPCNSGHVALARWNDRIQR